MKKIIQITSIALIIILVLNIALGLIPDLMFWFIIILGAISSFIVNRVLKPKL